MIDRPMLLLVAPEDLLNIPNENQLIADCLQQAIQSVVGLDVQVSSSDGHTLWSLTHACLTALNLTIGPEDYQAISEQFSAGFLKHCQGIDVGQWLQPGALSMCSKINAAEAPQSLVLPYSGLPRDIAYHLLENSGLAPYLMMGYGAYDSHGRTLPDLVEQGRALPSMGLPWPAHKTVVFCQHPTMLPAAISSGVKTVSLLGHQSCADADLQNLDDLPGLLVGWQVAPEQ